MGEDNVGGFENGTDSERDGLSETVVVRGRHGVDVFLGY
jgi:hypothetical protein